MFFLRGGVRGGRGWERGSRTTDSTPVSSGGVWLEGGGRRKGREGKKENAHTRTHPWGGAPDGVVLVGKTRGVPVKDPPTHAAQKHPQSRSGRLHNAHNTYTPEQKGKSIERAYEIRYTRTHTHADTQHTHANTGWRDEPTPAGEEGRVEGMGIQKGGFHFWR